MDWSAMYDEHERKMRLDLSTATLGMVVWIFNGGKMFPHILVSVDHAAGTVTVKEGGPYADDSVEVYPSYEVYKGTLMGTLAYVPPWLSGYEYRT